MRIKIDNRNFFKAILFDEIKKKSITFCLIQGRDNFIHFFQIFTPSEHASHSITNEKI